MDAGVESPLEVLSRAATMMQETQQQEDAAAAAKSQKQLPTTKWKRDRRTRPDYQRKSDAKLASDEEKSCSSASSSPTLLKANGVGESNTPLDMSTRQRGLPPSYSQAISDPSFRSAYTTLRPRTNGRDDLPTGISMCDPIIDEHFRRSLGKDYNTVFNNNAKESAKEKRRGGQTAAKPKTPVTSVTEMMDTTGLSVDDHFAKALGDTWHKLNNSSGEGMNNVRNATSNNNSVNRNSGASNNVVEVVLT